MRSWQSIIYLPKITLVINYAIAKTTEFKLSNLPISPIDVTVFCFIKGGNIQGSFVQHIQLSKAPRPN